jgi:micrococcal nuclease
MLWMLLAASVAAGTISPACHDAYLVEIKDGDTVDAIYAVGDDIYKRVSIRIAGVDTPEKGWRAGCAVEREKGEKASSWTKRLLQPLVGLRPVAYARICDVRRDKYAGRRVARLEIRKAKDGPWVDVGASLVAAGLARPYDGGTKPSWCAADPSHKSGE